MDTPFSGLELVFIFIAFTVFCVFSIAAIYTHNQPDTQDEKMESEQDSAHCRNGLKRKQKNASMTVKPELP
ncbi:hypothetical protein AMEX_G27727 [Astyanax mexicanus]|uniref:Small integral membrane protein 31 n=1 Tax=Astyanax mexicanus TaxID=7994 RepID=A0A8T2KQC6_ASTMX|nr:hypothetical protein AMEX_G27727 [Astyanax mexicanus]